MKSRNLIMSSLGVVAFMALLLLGVPQYAGAVPVCGPGAHWVDNCPSGTDSFSSDAQHTVFVFGIGNITANLSGPTTIFRSAGTIVPDHHIDTEIVSLNLTGGGFTLIVGAGLGTPSPTLPSSLGRITEQGNAALANSFFDVFFELQGPFPFGPLRNELSDPAHMKFDGLTEVPPPVGTMYFADNLPIGIFDAGPDGIFYTLDDVQRGLLIAATHTVGPEIIPEPATLALLAAGLALLGWGKRRNRV